METQWILFNSTRLRPYALLCPLRSAAQCPVAPALHLLDRVITDDLGPERVRPSNLALVQSPVAICALWCNPYDVINGSVHIPESHLDTFRLLEEKPLPPIADKFGWCTWDAFYLTVDPLGVWHGVKEFYDGGFSLRFLVIDDGWQSVGFDGGRKESLVIGGQQMTARLYRFEECGKFRRYKARSFLGPNCPSYDQNRTKLLISKQCEIEKFEKARYRAMRAGNSDEVVILDAKIARLKREVDESFDESNDDEDDEADAEVGFKAFTRDLRERFKGLDDIYAWQALCGAWGGVAPGSTQFDSRIIPVKLSPGLDNTMEDLAVVKIVEGGIGLVHPDQIADFYDAMHSYLSSVGITGAKVDVIHTLEYVCEEFGGRVNLAKAYYDGLTKSLVKNFNGTGMISSMQQCNDFFFLGTSQISFGRAGDDFWFQDPSGDPSGVYWLQGVHMVHCAYNSLWMGQIIQPDWDMFQSDHCCAKFHAGSRAICGGPIYLSDSVGCHDFALVDQLVFPDGTIPKCIHFALPTRDCLFKNPLFDGETILKIWNLNKYGGVIGAFNCQGAGWDTKEHKIRGYSQFYKPVSGSVHVKDIEWDQKKETSKISEAQQYAVYLNQAEKLILTTQQPDAIEITIQPSSFEILSFVPMTTISGCNVKFSPVGLTNMFNSGGAIVNVEYVEVEVKVKVKGRGRFLAYSSVKPKRVCLNGSDVKFEWLFDGGLMVEVHWREESGGVSEIVFEY
ncbi:LOW QUALITY PROTEIN: stachyose synthase-like [Asparagus officinalis]|uniref:LOW QUALITY PROTEIN: stachyose synthase-like n=1 Tax=Asparagus officinalis TaxID=4686 RepID=UPI00098E413D|nr:LOW QUALITY PROTEIN: stachyose synthase-like [Asparagus officinalis]